MADCGSWDPEIRAEEGKMQSDVEASVEDETEEDVYEVERIVGMCTSKGKTLYKVRWVGYSPQWDTWEPYENLASCREMVDSYVKEQKKPKEAGPVSRSVCAKDSNVSTTGPKPPEGAKRRDKKPSWVYVGSSDEEADTLKDKFWRNLEQGKVDVFSSDLYTRAKSSRSAKPQSFSEMFETGRKFQDGDVKTKKRRKKSRTSVDGDSKCEMDGVCYGELKGQKAGKLRGRPRRRDSKDSEASTKSTGSVASSRGSMESQGGESTKSSESRESSIGKKNKEDSWDGGMTFSVEPLPETRSRISCDPVKSENLPGVLDAAVRPAVDVAAGMEPATAGSNAGPNKDLWSETADSQSLLDHISRLAKNYPLSSDKSGSEIQPRMMELAPEFPVVLDHLTKRRRLDEADGLGGHQHLQQQQVPEQVHAAEKALNSSTPQGLLAPESCTEDFEMETPTSVGKRSQWGAVSPKQTVVAASCMAAQQLPTAPVNVPAVTSQCQPVQVPPSSSSKSAESPWVKNVPAPPKISGDPRLESRSSANGGLTTIDEMGCFDIDLAEISQDFQDKMIEEQLCMDALELSNEELRQAVKENNYRRASRAFKSGLQYDLEQADYHGNTLVMVAAQHGYDDMLEMLVLHGAQLHVENKTGATPLMLAAEQGLRCTVELLVLMGTNLNSQSHGGDTALMKAVKRGHKSVVRVLLDYGANFSSPNNGETPIKLAKHCNHSDIVDIINMHISRVSAEFENQVLVTLNNTAKIICALFPMQCFALRDNDKFQITFKHELQAAQPGMGVLLFVAHARISPHEAQCRFYGPCAVTAAVLNGVQLQPLTEDGHFVMSFVPLHSGRNELDIYTVKAPTSRAKLVVCAYKAQLQAP